jgi:DNA repair protein RecO (recombination protein O)
MEWSDEGIVLGARRHGESGAIVTLLTRAHGRHAGLVRGGAGRGARGLYEPGNVVLATWRARLSEHLGHFACELVEAHAAALLDDPLRLAALAAAAAVADAALPEREPHVAVYDRLKSLLARLADLEQTERWAPSWQCRYVRWELALLADLGFGLDLASCAAAGATDGLAYVSPRSGRAVSTEAGAAHADRLLRLPAFLLASESPATPAEILSGLDLTGFFLRRHVFVHRLEGKPANGGEPAARARFIARLRGGGRP